MGRRGLERGRKMLVCFASYTQARLKSDYLQSSNPLAEAAEEKLNAVLGSSSGMHLGLGRRACEQHCTRLHLTRPVKQKQMSKLAD